jgi:hypothetical protein
MLNLMRTIAIVGAAEKCRLLGDGHVGRKFFCGVGAAAPGRPQKVSVSVAVVAVGNNCERPGFFCNAKWRALALYVGYGTAIEWRLSGVKLPHLLLSEHTPKPSCRCERNPSIGPAGCRDRWSSRRHNTANARRCARADRAAFADHVSRQGDLALCGGPAGGRGGRRRRRGRPCHSAADGAGNGRCNVPAKVTPRRLPPPWTIQERPACFIVADGNGKALAYVYFEENPGRRAASNLMTYDEARRIVVNIAKLPHLLR